MAFATLVILLLILILVAWQPRLVSDPPIREAETLEPFFTRPPQ